MMKSKVSILCFMILLIFGQIVFGQEKGVGNLTVSKLPSKEKRWALIIGVDNYQKDISPLYGTVNDAKALRDALIKHAGFPGEQVILMTTDSEDADLYPNRGNIIDQLDKLQRVVPAGGLILFSFSGHGVSIGEDAFIVPADGRVYQDADLMRERTIDVLRIKRAIQKTPAKQVIMFLDACRNDPIRAKGDVDNNLTTAYKQGFSFETRNQNIEAYATLYATSFGDRAYEFEDKKTRKYRGYFSYAIEEGLKGSAANNKGEVTLAGLIRYIEDTVKERVNIDKKERQIPYLTTEGFRNSDLVIAVVEKDTPITTNLNSGEQLYWQEIAQQNSISGYERYLNEYPNGEFTKIAKIKLGKLKWENIKVRASLFKKYSYIGSALNVSNLSAWEKDLSSSELYIAELKDGLFNEKALLDKNGRELTLFKYERISAFSEGLARVAGENSRYGYIDKTGREIIPLKYEEAENFSDGLAKVKLNDKYGFIDKSGKMIIPFSLSAVSSFYDERAIVVTDDGGIHLIDKTGRRISANYNFVSQFNEGLSVFQKGEKVGFIDKLGKEVIPAQFDKADYFSEGLAVVITNEKVGFIDKTGKIIISTNYTGAEHFSEGLAGVCQNNKCGFINRKGEVVIPFKFDFLGRDLTTGASGFKRGFATVVINEKEGLIDKAGNVVIPVKYDKITLLPTEFSSRFIAFASNQNTSEKAYIIDANYREWEILIPPNARQSFGLVEFISQGFFGFSLDGKKGFVDIYGNEYFDF